jgi:hypothetical protein
MLIHAAFPPTHGCADIFQRDQRLTTNELGNRSFEAVYLDFPY